MSICKNYYVIAGYDLTGCTTDKYEEWKWSEDWEDLTCKQTKGNIQLFDDPMNGEYLYLGYVLATGDEYEFETTKINIEDIYSKDINLDVLLKLITLINAGLIEWKDVTSFVYKIIVFEECT